MKEVALHIGGIIRSFNVKRGIGTIRQDINISIHGGNRIEIKGFQDPSMMIKTINAEIRRQLDTLKKGEKVKSEVRKALPEGNTEFLRPMPGAARMYPETDLSVLKISREIINEAKKDMPKMRKDIEEELKHKGLNEEMIKILFKEDKFEEFRELLEITDNPLLVAKIILIFPKEILIKEKIPLSESEKIFNKNLFAFVLESFRSGKISESQIKNVLEKIAKGEKLETAILFEKEDTNIIEKKIMEIVKEKQGLSENAYMGLVMKEFKGKIDGKYAREIIAKLLK